MTTNAPFFKSITLSDVVLRVRDLETSATFYRYTLGFQVVSQEPDRIKLSPNGREPSLIVLERAPDALPRPPGSSGLFHAAILYPDRGSLGRITKTLLARKIRVATGDHGVSEAVYLDDPEGNGLELYADRPASVWPKPTSAGDTLGMYTEAVDLPSLLEAGGEDHAGPLMPTSTRLGHVHLSVANLSATERFYHELLGFDVTVRSFPGAIFLGRDGYHHHLGTNIWRSRTPAVEGVLGLVRFTLRFAQPETFSRVAQALGQATAAKNNGSLSVRDPNGIEVVVTLNSG